jgi:hypothetical protein
VSELSCLTSYPVLLSSFLVVADWGLPFFPQTCKAPNNSVQIRRRLCAVWFIMPLLKLVVNDLSVLIQSGPLTFLSFLYAHLCSYLQDNYFVNSRFNPFEWLIGESGVYEEQAVWCVRLLVPPTAHVCCTVFWVSHCVELTAFINICEERVSFSWEKHTPLAATSAVVGLGWVTTRDNCPWQCVAFQYKPSSTTVPLIRPRRRR